MKKVLIALAAATFAQAALASPEDADANLTVATMDWTLANCAGPIHPLALMGIGTLKPSTTPEGIKTERAGLEEAIKARFKTTEDACNSIMIMWGEAGQEATDNLDRALK